MVVWSYFVGTLTRIGEECSRQGIHGKTIWGGTPTGEDAGDASRAAIIQEFTDFKSSLDVLIANPAACAESISLHKTCGHAIYYDLSYNCAQYLQSLDRIHRVGGSETRTARYRFLMYEDTFEGEILSNLIGKAQTNGRHRGRRLPTGATGVAGTHGDDVTTDTKGRAPWEGATLSGAVRLLALLGNERESDAATVRRRFEETARD